MEKIGLFDKKNVGDGARRFAACFAMAAKYSGFNKGTMEEAQKLYQNTSVGPCAVFNTDEVNYLKFKFLETIAQTHNVTMPVGQKAFDEQIAAANQMFSPSLAVVK